MIQRPDLKLFLYKTKRDLLCGWWGGFCTGIVFMMPEYMKVVNQASNLSTLVALKQPGFLKRALLGTVTFPPLVAFVGAAQFTVNNRIRQIYGNFAGVIASALSGALFLTPGDHYMLRKQVNKENFIQSTKFFMRSKGFFVGFTAVTLRESIFMTNILYIGPQFGKMMKIFFGEGKKGDEISDFWKFVGRCTSGVVSTIVSQPFDVAARQQQLAHGVDPASKKGIIQTLGNLHKSYRKLEHQNMLKYIENHPWFIGSMCRMMLGTFGGAVLVGLYQRFSKIYDQNNKQ